MKRTYHGSCHCKAVTFEADIDLDRGTAKCNCTFCWKQRMWNAGQLQPGDLRVLSGEKTLGDYGKTGDWGETHHRFCTVCGIESYAEGIAPDSTATVGINLRSIEAIDVDKLTPRPFDGRSK